MTNYELLLHKVKFVVKNGFNFEVSDNKCIGYEQKLNGVRFEKDTLEEAVEAAFQYVSGIVYNGLLSGQLSVEQASEYFPSAHEMQEFMKSGRLFS